MTRQGSATGFLVDSSGWLLTNRHVAEPWRYEEDLAFLQAPDANVEPRFLTLRAYFPPGDRSYPLRVFATSTVVDVASLRTDDRPIEAPVLPLAPRDVLVPPGEDVIFFGFPTGVHNLLFRLAEAERSEVLAAIGEEPVKLAREIARRRIVQPLVIAGTVSDTTSTEVIHTAGTTGGGSGGPLLNARGEVIGIHYAAVRSPIEGDPFQTQRGVPASFAWEVLPLAIRDRIEARASTGQR